MIVGSTPDTVMLAWLFVVNGALVVWLCITRMAAVLGKNFERKRKISEWIVLCLAGFIGMGSR
jgi:hypothetical protein